MGENDFLLTVGFWVIGFVLLLINGLNDISIRNVDILSGIGFITISFMLTKLGIDESKGDDKNERQ